MHRFFDTPPIDPVINEAILDADTLYQLFDDVSRCTHLIEVTVKHNRRSQPPDINYALEQARQLLEDGSVLGIQLRYLYDNAWWWGTLYTAHNDHASYPPRPTSI